MAQLMTTSPENGRPSRWEVFSNIAECLGGSFLQSRRLGFQLPTAWEMVVAAASAHLVSPALGWALQNRDELSPAVSEYFSAVLELNRQRNARVSLALERVLQLLNAQ